MLEFSEWSIQAQIITGLLTALGTALVVLRPLWKWLKKLGGDIMFMFGQREAHQQIRAQLQMIIDELMPNGGGSLGDAVRRTEKKVDFLGARHLADLNGAKMAMVETDANGHVVWVNRAYVAMTGRGIGDVSGEGWVNVIAPEARRAIYDEWARTVASRRTMDMDMPFINTKGNVFVAHVVANPIISKGDNKFHGYLAEIAPYDDETPEEQREE